jgi:hypothetical protein
MKQFVFEISNHGPNNRIGYFVKAEDEEEARYIAYNDRRIPWWHPLPLIKTEEVS